MSPKPPRRAPTGERPRERQRAHRAAGSVHPPIPPPPALPVVSSAHERERENGRGGQRGERA